MIFEIKQSGQPLRRMQSEPSSHEARAVGAAYVMIDDQWWLQIENSHLMPEFFTTPISSDDHWMFVSSNGALTAGRKNADHSLFPYYSSDKLADMAAASGPVTHIRVAQADGTCAVWQPFANAQVPADCVRNVYKSVHGDRLLFEETNTRLSLVFRYQWSFGKQFGFIRTCELVNRSAAPVSVSVLDGLQNLMPAGLSQEFQLRYSNLGDAYKKSELLESSQVGLYYLSSVPTDQAEPSEGLRATVAWQSGLPQPNVLLSTDQVQRFVKTGQVEQERDVRGKRGAYLVQANLELPALDSASWHVVANVEQSGCDVARLRGLVEDQVRVAGLLASDIDCCQDRLLSIVSSADGRQSGRRKRETHRHQSNVTYNVMRGGLPANQYQIDTREFADYLLARNISLHRKHGTRICDLAQTLTLSELMGHLEESGDADLLRLGREYLPLTFSRRHGDPSRPWNRFSIDLYSDDGSPKLAYEGNWRDIFQNWEALAFSWPGFTMNMIRRFVNASTADGYNPYRLTSEGFDWERPSEDEFSNIGYWGDHQIVYLLKLLEWARVCQPAESNRMLSETGCTYALVPYRIADYQTIKRDSSNTITFDYELDRLIDGQVATLGSDGKLLRDHDGEMVRATMLEKLLLPALVKMTNFVPGGGIWLNTQRPEWNDANNALVGRGMSVVTVCYLRRYFQFLTSWFKQADQLPAIEVSSTIAQLAFSIGRILRDQQAALASGIDPQRRQDLVDELSQVGSDYRQVVYDQGLSDRKQLLTLEQCVELFETCVTFLDDCIDTNRRGDGLYHAYNLMQQQDGGIEVERLAEMLEGQVAAISSGALSAVDVCDVLDALQNSRLRRSDVGSYLLYPDRSLPTFMEKNVVSRDLVDQSALLVAMLGDGDDSIISADCSGSLRFSADFRNADYLNERLDQVAQDPVYTSLVKQDRSQVVDIYEQTFRHHRFTGRSENFFAYEGLGSIYWHMVSKLALATLEQLMQAISVDAAEIDWPTVERLKHHYSEIREGLGVNKTPAEFGAFPTDPYSHTPAHAGAQQPGMTGQVKEDVLCRMLEIGARVDAGQASFDPRLFSQDEFHDTSTEFDYVSIEGHRERIVLPEGTFAWTWCQVPIVYHHADEQRLEFAPFSGDVVQRDELSLTAAETDELFQRKGSIARIDVYFVPGCEPTTKDVSA